MTDDPSYRTKQERRELQERQRAAKAAKAAANGASGKPGAKPAGGQGPTAGGSGTPSKKAGRVSDTALRPPTTPSAKAAEKAKAGLMSAADQSAGNQARGLLIFSHFGLPKPVSAAKGDIHPAIARTALLFSSFKIAGANARCIATLNAFKTVRYCLALFPVFMAST